jgi:hypothetical protein
MPGALSLGASGVSAPRLNGWQVGHKELHRTSSSRMRRAHRRKALERGEATPLLQPFSKRLTEDARAAIDEYLAKKAGQR